MKCQTLGGYLTWLTMLVPLSLFCLAAATLTGCGTPRAHTSPPTVQKAVVAPGARLTEATAVQVGAALARQKGINLMHYEPPEVRFDLTRRQWRLFYMEKPPGRPGGHFTVTVDDQTMEAQFHGGA